MRRSFLAVRAEAFTLLNIVQESGLTPVRTEAQRQERDERIRALGRFRDRLHYMLTELEAIKERARTRRFIWEALAGMPQYPAYVIAAMIFQEYLANMPWQFPVFVLRQVWEQREASARREIGTSEGSARREDGPREGSR
ncbi:hypothetical protein MMC32_006236 [Xylographa parallela]|nr:hypothetical protein [Xylographa parallela]